MKPEAPSPKQLEEHALIAYQEGRLEDGIEGFNAAHNAYQAQGDEGKTAEMANNLSVVLLQAKRPKEALKALEGTTEVFLRLGDTQHAAQAFGNLGAALEACGDVAAAELAYRRAADLFSNLGDVENQDYTLQALSRLQLRLGKPLEAITTMQTSLEAKPRPGIRDRWLRRLLRLPYRLLGR
jgi:tetratricopeptide (TPR) repeat protein